MRYVALMIENSRAGGTCINHNGVYYLWYEGYGGGRDRDTAFDEGGRSQIGLATLSGVRFADLFT